jgi:hypothetical protein
MRITTTSVRNERLAQQGASSAERSGAYPIVSAVVPHRARSYERLIYGNNGLSIIQIIGDMYFDIS